MQLKKPVVLDEASPARNRVRLFTAHTNSKFYYRVNTLLFKFALQ